MTIKVRLSGEPDQIDAMIDHLSDAFEVAGGDRAYPTRGSFGVRLDLEIRPRPGQPTVRRVRSERVHPHRQEIEP